MLRIGVVRTLSKATGEMDLILHVRNAYGQPVYLLSRDADLTFAGKRPLAARIVQSDGASGEVVALQPGVPRTIQVHATIDLPEKTVGCKGKALDADRRAPIEKDKLAFDIVGWICFSALTSDGDMEPIKTEIRPAWHVEPKD